jgi:hypothetical protein
MQKREEDQRESMNLFHEAILWKGKRIWELYDFIPTVLKAILLAKN